MRKSFEADLSTHRNHSMKGSLRLFVDFSSYIVCRRVYGFLDRKNQIKRFSNKSFLGRFVQFAHKASY